MLFILEKRLPLMLYFTKRLLRDHRTVVSTLKQFGDLHGLLGDKYRAKAYSNAVRSLEAFEILQLSRGIATPYTCGKELANLPGIGSGLVQKIDEILTTGELTEFVEAKKQPAAAAVKELTRVHGIGPVTALSMFQRYGISTVEQLRKQHEASVKDPKPLLTSAQCAGLIYLSDIEQRIPRDEVSRHAMFIRDIVLDVFGEEAVVCGSYRRGLPTVGDVDVLVPSDLVGKTDAASKSQWETKMEILLNRFQQPQKANHVYHLVTLAQGPTKWMTISRLEPTLPARRVDLRFVPKSHFSAALLYFTGSKQFNIDMRAKAAAKGFLLNEYGLFKLHPQQEGVAIHVTSPKCKKSKKILARELQNFSLENIPTVESDRVTTNSEEEIFKALGLKFIDPKER